MYRCIPTLLVHVVMPCSSKTLCLFLKARFTTIPPGPFWVSVYGMWQKRLLGNKQMFSLFLWWRDFKITHSSPEEVFTCCASVAMGITVGLRELYCNPKWLQFALVLRQFAIWPLPRLRAAPGYPTAGTGNSLSVVMRSALTSNTHTTKKSGAHHPVIKIQYHVHLTPKTMDLVGL